MLNQAYEAVINFIRSGNLPKHIKDCTLRYYHAFGTAGFFPRDIRKIRGFAGSIVVLDFKLRHSDAFYEKFVHSTGNIVKDEELE